MDLLSSTCHCCCCMLLFFSFQQHHFSAFGLFTHVLINLMHLFWLIYQFHTLVITYSSLQNNISRKFPSDRSLHTFFLIYSRILAYMQSFGLDVVSWWLIYVLLIYFKSSCVCITYYTCIFLVFSFHCPFFPSWVWTSSCMKVYKVKMKKCWS